MITRAIIPAAGSGSRMAKLTGGGIKEMLPLAGKPMIYYYQPEPYGLADAVDRCEDYPGNEPLAVLLPDTIFCSAVPAIVQVEPVFRGERCNIIGLMRVKREEAALYGNCGRVEEYRSMDETVVEIARLQDKESGEFSTLGREEVLRTFPRYTYLPEVFGSIERATERTAGELDEVPVLQDMVTKKQLLGVILEGEGYDTVNPRGYEHVKNVARPGEMSSLAAHRRLRANGGRIHRHRCRGALAEEGEPRSHSED